MTVPNIDTFEHDIAEEIKVREATLTDIASASGEVGNIPTDRSKTSSLLLVIGIFCIVIVILGTIAFLIYTSKRAAEYAPTPAPVEEPSSANLFSLSTYLNDAIAGYVTSINKNEYGYTLLLAEYTPVFAYMIKNERLYADEVALAVGSPRETGTTSLPFVFTDVTRSNQNMRVGTSGSSTVVYGFVNTQALIISSSTEGVLTLRNAILAR